MWMECETAEERAELWQSIMEFGLYGKEPPQKFKRDFVNVKFILNRSKQISKKRGTAWSSHVWNQYTEWDEKRKSNDKAQKKAVEQMEQNGTNGTNKNKNRNRIEEEMYKEETTTPIKKFFGTMVELTQAEYDRLAQKFWESTIAKYIAFMDSYCVEHNKQYKDYNLALQKWMAKDNIKEIPQQTTNTTRREDGIYDIDL